MTYSGDTPIKGTGQASAVVIDDWMQHMGQQLAPVYAPDQMYIIPPPVGQPIVTIATQYGLNSDLIAAQICKESAGWQSAIVRAKNNPSGLGAINNDPMGGAIMFSTPEAGIRATVAHLLSYVDGTASPLWAEDPRAVAIPSQNVGAVHVLSDLNGRWAVPGPTYGQDIAALANQLVQFGGEMTADAINGTHNGYPVTVNFGAGRGGVTHLTRGSSYIRHRGRLIRARATG